MLIFYIVLGVVAVSYGFTFLVNLTQKSGRSSNYNTHRSLF